MKESDHHAPDISQYRTQLIYIYMLYRKLVGPKTCSGGREIVTNYLFLRSGIQPYSSVCHPVALSLYCLAITFRVKLSVDVSHLVNIQCIA
jgi:hypothetical protein